MPKTKACKHCGSELHLSLKCFNAPRKPIAVKKKRKPTIAQINKKLKEGGNLTVAEKKIQYSKQKDKAWKAFSDYIRHRDCYKTTKTFDYGTCITCVVRGDYTQYPYKRIQAGHGVGGRKNAVLFHEQIVNGQCDHCNRQGMGGLSGDYGNYMAYFVREYGLEHAEGLQRLKNAYLNYTYDDLVDIECKYKQKLEELKSKDQRIKLL